MTAEAIQPAPGAAFGVDDFRERLARFEAQLGNCATREDLARFEARLANCATREDIADIRTLIADVRTLIEQRQAETMRWLVTVLSGTLVAIAIVLVRTFL